MNDAVYGKLRKEDVPVLKSVVAILKKHKLNAGLHGTSLWNPKYKDVDLLVVSDKNGAREFLWALDEMKETHGAEILEQKGNETIGLDYDIKIGTLILHLSYVVLL